MFKVFKKEKKQMNTFEELEKNLAELDRLSEELDDLNNTLMSKITSMNQEVERITSKLAML